MYNKEYNCDINLYIKKYFKGLHQWGQPVWYGYTLNMGPKMPETKESCQLVLLKSPVNTDGILAPTITISHGSQCPFILKTFHLLN